MNIEIKSMIGDLRRERWSFRFTAGVTGIRFWLDSWVFETRETTRHRTWHRQSWWNRLDKRDNTCSSVRVPSDVVERAKASIIEHVNQMSVTYGEVL